MNRLVPLMCFVLAACAATDVETPDQGIDGPKPVFPASEVRIGREGWVVVDYSVSTDGSVSSLSVVDSSGSDSFDAAALQALEQWQFEPASDAYESSVLVKFVWERSRPKATQAFLRRYLQVKNLIDAGNLDEASQQLEDLADKPLYPTELAYVWLARAHVADLRGDKDTQLDCFRKAMISQGQWIDRRLYLELLRATTILGLETNDYASAVRDYDELMESPVGREMAADLEPAVSVARDLAGDAGPYEVALSQLVVKRPGRSASYGSFRQPTDSLRSGWDTPRQPPPTPATAPPTQSRL